MEDLGYMESLLSSLRKPQNCKRLLQILIALRKQVNGPDHRSKIQQIDVNSLKVLVACTQHDANLKVIDLALSILGNCCTNQFVVRQSVHTLNLLDHLNRVLKKHEKDSIRGRVFRILGNLCDGVEPLEIVKKEPAVINGITNFLKEFSKNEILECNEDQEKEEISSTFASVVTVSMALRFIRKILVRQTFDILVNDHQLIKVIGALMVKCANMWLHNKKNHLLLSDVIKIMQLFSSSSYIYDDIITELKSTENGDALKALGDVILLHPDKITKIMLKLGRILRSQSDLPIEAIITNLINAVDVNEVNTHNKEYLGCINKLMDHVGFQDKLNRSNNINLLVKLLEDFDAKNDFSVTCCLQICSILNKCKYNESLVKSQLNSNVILIITEKLELVTGKASNKINLVTHEVKKSPTYKNVKRFKSNKQETDLTINCDSVKGFDAVLNRSYCASPSSSSEISSCGPFSPSSSTRALCNDSGSENYSPLCSEDEGDEEIKLSIPDDDLILSETEDHRPIYNQDQMELRCKLRDEMNLLLKFYCTLKPMYQHLGNPKLMTILINLILDPSINEEHGDLAYSILISIAQTREFLIPLMVSGIIIQIHEVIDTKHDDSCVECDILQSKAEDIVSKFLSTGKSESLKGDIAYIMLNNKKDDVKEKLVLSIPYVIRNINWMSKFMKECGGLKILMKLLKDQKNAYMQERCIKAICILATDNLKIKSPVIKKTKGKTLSSEIIHIGAYNPPELTNSIVTFKLDDGSTLNADRNILNEKSDYFNALLNGQFIESKQNEISIKNVSKQSLSCLLQLLDKVISTKISFQFDYDLDTILEVIVLSDRFLLNDLSYSLVCHVEQLISMGTVSKFYKWAIESGTNILRIESVAFALVGDISYKDRLNVFYTLFNLGYSVELIEDVEKLILQFL